MAIIRYYSTLKQWRWHEEEKGVLGHEEPEQEIHPVESRPEEGGAGTGKEGRSVVPESG